MLVFNIRKAKFATALSASGIENRWNKEDEFIIYTGSSVSLATLEMVAHRSAINTHNDYKLLNIKLEIDEKADVTAINIDDLPKNWRSINAYPLLQEIGSEWYRSKKSLILKVPSALVPREYNFLINTRHPDFEKKVTLLESEDFEWDGRLL